MSYKSKGNVKSEPNHVHKETRPVVTLTKSRSRISDEEKINGNYNLQTVKEETKEDLTDDTQDNYKTKQAFKSEVKRFIKISKYFSSPMRKSASYMCENCLVSYPNPYKIEYKRGSITTQYMKFSNITLEPVYIKFYKIIPDIEHVKFINMSLSRCKRVPPGLFYNLGVAYDDVEEKAPCNARMIFVASRKTSTPCYQICEINLHIDPQKIRLISV